METLVIILFRQALVFYHKGAILLLTFINHKGGKNGCKHNKRHDRRVTYETNH